MLPTLRHPVCRVSPPIHPPFLRRLLSLCILVTLLTLVPVQQGVYAQTDTPTVRRDRHIDREVQIRYPRARVTPEPAGGQERRGDNRVWRAGPSSSGGTGSPAGPNGPARPTPQ